MLRLHLSSHAHRSKMRAAPYFMWAFSGITGFCPGPLLVVVGAQPGALAPLLVLGGVIMGKYCFVFHFRFDQSTRFGTDAVQV
jgi:FtsH-binding integral membrane protein